MNIFIVAGGNGIRFDRLSVFPKLLLPCTGYGSILESHLHTFKGNEIYVIINNKFYDMLVNYCRVTNIDNIHIIPSDNSNGSYNTIMSVRNELPDNDILFVWSDLIINSIDINSIENNTIFTYDGDYRYSYSNGVLTNVGKGGNVPGVYYIKSFPVLDICEEEKDFVEYIVDDIAKGSKYISREIKSMTEYRDYDTYIREYKNHKDSGVKPRFFNSITVKGNGLEKKCTDSKYRHLIQKEIEWYNMCPDKSVIPEIYHTDYENGAIEMEYLDGYIPLYEYVEEHKENDGDILKVYDNLNGVISKISKKKQIVSRNQFTGDLRKEVVLKTIDRCDKISDMLINYDRNETLSLLNRAYDKILSINNNGVEYAFGHGDINGSNAMVNLLTKEVKIIDPRGYFGDTKMYIWPEYERAKILYCLSGYDDFNNNPQIYLSDEPKSIGVTEIVDKIFHFNETDYILLYVIWVALAGYISQDILKANIAYEYGINKLKELI